MRWRWMVLVLAIVALQLVPAASVTAEAIITEGCIASVPEPATSVPVGICYTLYRPVAATAEAPVPLIFHSHGWAGSRERSPTAFGSWLDAGFGVLSFDQRGFGASGGKAHLEHPDFEGQDVQRLVDVVAGLDWVTQEAPGDPVLGAIGGSYGGGYQFVGAFTELRDRGATRFDALAPEITWWDLPEALAPQGVVRTVWAVALYAAGLLSDAHTTTVHEAFLYGVATGDWPEGELLGLGDLDAFLRQNGPAWHVAQGRRLDIPVVLGQGITDNLFNLNQGVKNFTEALTPSARARSILVGYNGGHTIPSVLPEGMHGAGDPCSVALSGGDFGELTRRFLQEELLGESTGLGGRGLAHIATPAGGCVTVASTEPNASYPVGTIATTAGVGVPLAWKVADGPVTVAGTPWLDASVTTLGVDARVFFALSVGTNPLDARIVADNMLPMREPLPVSGAARSIELPAMAVDVPAGQSLFVTVSPLWDQSIGHGSRVPGVVLLENAVVRLPVVGPVPPPLPANPIVAAVSSLPVVTRLLGG